VVTGLDDVTVEAQIQLELRRLDEMRTEPTPLLLHKVAVDGREKPIRLEFQAINLADFANLDIANFLNVHHALLLLIQK
jgi:hypothetical protein